MYKIFFALLLICLQNSFANQIDKTMHRYYKVPVKLIEKFYAPLDNKNNILILYPKSKYKAPYLGSKLIFVKKGVNSLGTYKWNKSKHIYINIDNSKTLTLDKMIYIIIHVKKYKKSFTFKKEIRKLDKKHLSENILKSVFHTYASAKPDSNKFGFYKQIISKLKKKHLIGFKNKEYFVLLDRGTQKIYIFMYNKISRYRWIMQYIGADKVSSGNPALNSRNHRFFQTPLAVFNRQRFKRGDWHTDKKNFAEYGYKGNRIYYLGKYIIPIKHGTRYKREVHLAIHTTNPIDILMLGHKASKGCIRITPELNNIFNKSGIIDNINGKYIVVIDSKLSTKENLKRIKYFK